MHADQAATDPDLVRRLLAGQHPQWADQPIELVESYGTDHDVYRVGSRLAARLPLTDWATRQAATEARWLPRFTPYLPLALPVQVATGHPAEGYPHSWSVYEWLPGRSASEPLPAQSAIGPDEQAAVDLAAFVTALRSIDTTGAHARSPHARGGPLAEADEQVRRSLSALGDRVDAGAVRRAWDDALAAPPWPGPDVWVHGDLLPGNLLVADGRLSAVIDWGGLNVGDPACDLQAAWNVFTGPARQRFLSELAVDDASWRRGRGWVVQQTVSALPYYWDTNPGIVRQATRALAEVLADSSR